LKKTAAILLCLILIFPLVGLYPWLAFQQKMVKKEIKWLFIKGINPSELLTLTFTQNQINNQLVWKHSKEFMYNGLMYDIVSSKTSGNVTTYLVWLDKKETALNQKLNKLVGMFYNENPIQKQQNQSFFNWIKQLYHQFFIPDNIKNESSWLPSKKLNNYLFSVIKICIKTLTPPPQII